MSSLCPSLTIVLLLFHSTVAFAEPNTSCSNPDPSAACKGAVRDVSAHRVPRIGLEILLGAATGATLGATGFYIGNNGSFDMSEPYPAAGTLGVIGALGGLGTGVFLGGELLGGDGSLFFTFLGLFGGTALSIPVGFLVTDPDANQAWRDVVAIGVGIAFPLTGAILGYELTSPNHRNARRSQSFVMNTGFLPLPGGGSLTLAGHF